MDFATLRATEAVAAYPLSAKQGFLTTALVWRNGESPLVVKALQSELSRHRKALKGARV